MNQYCRYCANAYLQDDDLIWCESKNEIREKKNCITVNHCKHFIFNELDVFDIEKKYVPIKAKRNDGTQTTFDL